MLICLTVPVSKPYILLSDSSPVEGVSVWMRCGLENGTGPIHYVWEQENHSGQVSILAESDSDLINITSVSRNQTGWFRCLARNEVNQQSGDRIWLDVICEWELGQYLVSFKHLLHKFSVKFSSSLHNCSISLVGPDLPQIDVTPYSVTDRGYSALERETVSLLCQASSNPPSLYVWFYNNSQVYTGPQLTITKILRMHTGYYACLAQNTYLNTRSKKTITLTVYCESSTVMTHMDRMAISCVHATSSGQPLVWSYLNFTCLSFIPLLPIILSLIPMYTHTHTVRCPLTGDVQQNIVLCLQQASGWGKDNFLAAVNLKVYSWYHDKQQKAFLSWPQIHTENKNHRAVFRGQLYSYIELYTVIYSYIEVSEVSGRGLECCEFKSQHYKAATAGSSTSTAQNV